MLLITWEAKYIRKATAHAKNDRSRKAASKSSGFVLDMSQARRQTLRLILSRNFIVALSLALTPAHLLLHIFAYLRIYNMGAPPILPANALPEAQHPVPRCKQGL